jgi:hypothetical protein
MLVAAYRWLLPFNASFSAFENHFHSTDKKNSLIFPMRAAETA